MAFPRESFARIFTDAVITENIAELRRILKRKPADFDVDQQNLLSRSIRPLEYAVMQRNCAMVKLLVNCGANIFLKTSEGHTYLHLAVYRQDVELIKLFSSCISWGETNGYFCPLELLYARYKLDSTSQIRTFVAECLRDERNHDLIRVHKQIELYNAVDEKNWDKTRELLIQGADPNFLSLFHAEWTFHKSLVAFPNIDAFNVFLKHGAKVHLKTRNGLHSLYYAVKGGSVDVVRAILQMGVDPNERAFHRRPCWFEFYNTSSLDRRPTEEEILTILRLLAENGADLGFVHEAGTSCLVGAVMDNQSKVVEYLLSLGVDASGRGAMIPILQAIKKRNYRIAEVLLNYGVNTDMINDEPGKFYSLLRKLKDAEFCCRFIKLLLRKTTNLVPFLNLQFGSKMW